MTRQLQFNNVMIDLETMGTVSRSCITSIAAVEFSLQTGEIGKTFKMNVSLQSCLERGLVIEEGTFYWWLNQPQEAKDRLLDERKDIVFVLDQLDKFIAECDHPMFYWGNSARFDLGILEDAYRACGRDKPWNWMNERCVRTYKNAFVIPEVQFTGTKHNPTDDCLHQIKQIHEVFKCINF